MGRRVRAESPPADLGATATDASPPTVSLVTSPADDLDIGSTAFFLAEAPGHSHSVGTFLLLEGDADVFALAAALDAGIAATPRFRSRVVDRGGPVRHRWAWHADPAGEPTKVVDLGHFDPARGLLGIVDHLYDRGRRERRLRCEHPVRATVATAGRDHTVVLLERHHAAADATTTYLFLRDVLAYYHRTLTGEIPAWVDVPAIHAAVTGDVRTGAPVLETIHSLVRQRRHPRGEITDLAGTGCDDACQLVGRATVDDAATTTDLRQRARRLDASVTDLLVAATMRAVQEWNDRRGAPAGRQRHDLPVAQQSHGRHRRANQLSLISVSCEAADLDDRDALVRSVARQRRDLLERGVDITSAQMAETLSPLAWVQPSWRRRFDAEPWRPTSVVTNPGVFWPEVVDGHPTGATALTETGGLSVTDTLTVLNSGAAPALRVTTFRGRLRLDVANNQEEMTQAEVSAFAELVRDELLAFL